MSLADLANEDTPRIPNRVCAVCHVASCLDDGDGDIGGAWGVAFNASQVTAIGLLDLATQAVRNPEEDA